jgi:hypothetical protein
MTLIEEIETYLDHTGMKPTTFGKVFGNPSFIEELRCGRKCRPTTICKVRAFMAEKPEGIAPIRKSKPRPVERHEVVRMYRKTESVRDKIDPSSLNRVHRAPCWNCGVRGDIGCEHFPKLEAWA